MHQPKKTRVENKRMMKRACIDNKQQTTTKYPARCFFNERTVGCEWKSVTSVLSFQAVTSGRTLRGSGGATSPVCWAVEVSFRKQGTTSRVHPSRFLAVLSPAFSPSKVGGGGVQASDEGVSSIPTAIPFQKNIYIFKNHSFHSVTIVVHSCTRPQTYPFLYLELCVRRFMYVSLSCESQRVSNGRIRNVFYHTTPYIRIPRQLTLR